MAAFDTLTSPSKMLRPVGGCFLEHLGLLSEPAYRRRWLAELDWYRSQGVLPEDEGEGEVGILVTTTEEKGIDSAGSNISCGRFFGL